MSRDACSYIRLLRAPSSLTLSISKDGASTASLGNLCQCLTTLTVKNFFLISNLILPFFLGKPFPLVLSPETLLKSLSPTETFPPRGRNKYKIKEMANSSKTQ